MAKLSVIVPFYNSEDYIKDCLLSIVNQTFSDIEIILVNDGSQDRSRDICLEFQKNDDRIKLVDKVNGGVSSARNTGLDLATGEYITFVDSDDSICLDMYDKMLPFMSDDVDIVCCGINRIKADGKVVGKMLLGNGKIYYTPSEAMAGILDGKIGFSVYTKIFRAQLFNAKESRVRFPEGRLMEEAYILPQLLKKTRKLCHIGEAKYNYYIRNNSYTTKTLNEDCFYIYDTIVEYQNSLGKLFPGIMNSVERWKIANCINLYRKAISEKNRMKAHVYDRIKKEFEEIFLEGLLSPYISLKQRVMLVETFSGLYRLRISFSRIGHLK